MNIDEIYWHDSMIHKIVEDSEKDTLSFEVDYPTDWENQKWEKRTIRFFDVLNYEVHEGAYYGCPIILDASIIGEKDSRQIIRIETNAGYRKLAFKSIELK
jgi:hypothetical protein